MVNQIIKVENGLVRSEESQVTHEAPVSLTVNGEVWLTFMCTPFDLEALAIGFLYNEGMIDALSDVANLRVCPAADNVDVWTHSKLARPTHWRRTSGCTGGNTHIGKNIDLKYPVLSPSTNGNRLTIRQVYSLFNQLLMCQDLYRQFGGVHTSALTNGSEVIISAEDIGRHNTLDKIAGHCLFKDVHLDRTILLTTGRISSEMLQKAARMGASMLISRTSPSTLSILMAEDFGITLIGYARKNQFIIYSHPERINLDDSSQFESLDRIHQHGQDL
jgi:FdhD protein